MSLECVFFLSHRGRTTLFFKSSYLLVCHEERTKRQDRGNVQMLDGAQSDSESIAQRSDTYLALEPWLLLKKRTSL